MTSVNITGNNWNCDCTMTWMMQSVHGDQVTYASYTYFWDYNLNIRRFSSNVHAWVIFKLLWLGWLVFNDSTRDKDDTTVGVGHSRRHCNTGYDQSQGRRPSTLKCIGPISKGDIEPQPSRQKLIRNRTASRLRNDGRSRRYVQYREDQSQTETMIANHPPIMIRKWLYVNSDGWSWGGLCG